MTVKVCRHVERRKEINGIAAVAELGAVGSGKERDSSSSGGALSCAQKLRSSTTDFEPRKDPVPFRLGVQFERSERRQRVIPIHPGPVAGERVECGV